jgi:tRNA(Ile)-lysidine synthase
LDALSEFARRTLGAVRDAGWPSPGARWLLATSGGPDSTALAAALAELRAAGELPVALRVAHLDHAIRSESAAEAEWVARLADRLGLEFVAGRADVPALRARERLSLEAAARQARMAFLERAALDWGAACVLTGHTADDQAETVLFRILRGTGLKGLGGIPAARPISEKSPGILLVRPLLGLTRQEVLAYLAGRGLEYLTDRSNFDVEHQARARIRHQLLPEMERSLGPGVRGALVRLAAQAREAYASLRAAAEERLKSAAGEVQRDGLRLPLEALDCPRALRAEVFILAAERVARAKGPGPSLNKGRLARAAEFLASAAAGARFELGAVAAERGCDCVMIRRAEGPHPGPLPKGEGEGRAPGWSCPVAVPGTTELPVGRLVARVVERKGFDLDGFFKTKTPLAEAFDARVFQRRFPVPGSQLPGTESWELGTVVCRTRRPGDRFHAFGAPGEKKLKGFLIDRKLPRAERDAVPLLVLGGEILWVVGARLSEKARIPPDAERLVLMEFAPKEGSNA